MKIKMKIKTGFDCFIILLKDHIIFFDNSRFDEILTFEKENEILDIDFIIRLTKCSVVPYDEDAPIGFYDECEIRKIFENQTPLKG